MTVGDFIRSARKARRLSLRALAQAVHVDAAHLSRVEAGKVRPSGQLLARLAKALGADADTLSLLSGRVPRSLLPIVQAQPEDVIAALKGVETLGVREALTPYRTALVVEGEPRALEDGFPFEEISDVAEVESWRKEIYRPIYHVHKWWAQRLGSVFRAALLAAAAPRGLPIMELFYQAVKLPGLVVFDPFMGSGTIVGEAHKLGCAAVGRDINPVACFAVRTALGPMQRDEVEEAFHRVQETAEDAVRSLYRERDAHDGTREVLYYFWVKVLPCPRCATRVDLFSSYIFARHADSQTHPQAQAVCPRCGGLQQITLECSRTECRKCGHAFDPSRGPARVTTAVCSECGEEFPIAKTARAAGRPPDHRMYAKLVLTADGRKEYLPTDKRDAARYAAVEDRLRTMPDAFPVVEIPDGYNTRQVLNYGYRYWHDMFNARQLLGLTLLARAITSLPPGNGRDALTCLLSGTLEFNNMFATYKGEGTGAVRHLFSHHILKPERTPIEANIWGTPKSSGAFSTLYRSRLLRALEYREAPFELRLSSDGRRKSGRKVFNLSPPMGGPILERYPTGGLRSGELYLSCGDSSATDLPDEAVDLVVTDPPFFDNVHYSELADFFHVWLSHWRGVGGPSSTTRRLEEVQNADPHLFSENLQRVLRECQRVLKADGLMVFSYHHSREEGWSALAEAVLGAGFSFVQSQPVKAEMSVATPKSQAKEPIDLDVLLVCKKVTRDNRARKSTDAVFRSACDVAAQRIGRFNARGRRLSRNDVRVVLLSQLLVEATAGRTGKEAQTAFANTMPAAQRCVDRLFASQQVSAEQPSDGQGMLFAMSSQPRNAS